MDSKPGMRSDTKCLAVWKYSGRKALALSSRTSVVGAFITIHREQQRLAQYWPILQWRLCQVHAEPERADPWRYGQLCVDAFAQRIQRLRRHHLGQVQVAGGEALQFGGGVFGDVEAHARDRDGAGVVEVRVALGHETPAV